MQHDGKESNTNSNNNRDKKKTSTVKKRRRKEEKEKLILTQKGMVKRCDNFNHGINRSNGINGRNANLTKNGSKRMER